MEARRAEGVVRDRGRKARVIEAIATRMRGLVYGVREVCFGRVQNREGRKKKVNVNVNVKGHKSQGKGKSGQMSLGYRRRWGFAGRRRGGIMASSGCIA